MRHQAPDELFELLLRVLTWEGLVHDMLLEIEVATILPIMTLALDHDTLTESIDDLETRPQLVEKSFALDLTLEDEDSVDDHQIARLVHTQPCPIDAGDSGAGGLGSGAHGWVVYTVVSTVLLDKMLP